MTRRRGTTDPFNSVMPYILAAREGPDAVTAYWQKHRDAWIANHQELRGPDSMPEPWWRERGVLVADDPDEPIDWRQYVEESHHVTPETLDHLARRARLDQRRRAYLMETIR